MLEKIYSAAHLRRELIVWGVCFVVSFIYNLAIIAKYAAPWHEIFTSLGNVLVKSLLIYGLILLLRIAWYILGYLKHK